MGQAVSDKGARFGGAVKKWLSQKGGGGVNGWKGSDGMNEASGGRGHG